LRAAVVDGLLTVLTIRNESLHDPFQVGYGDSDTSNNDCRTSSADTISLPFTIKLLVTELHNPYALHNDNDTDKAKLSFSSCHRTTVSLSSNADTNSDICFENCASDSPDDNTADAVADDELSAASTDAFRLSPGRDSCCTVAITDPLLHPLVLVPADVKLDD
jgi:hypothetical protein